MYKALACVPVIAEVTQTKVVVLTDSALGESEIDESNVEAAIKRAQAELAAIDHNLDSEEVAYLQGVIAKSMVALNFKRKTLG
jgi:F0F1-type ATP synthase epsilon subunit